MKEDLSNHLNDPRQLEMLYRKDKRAFKREFSALYPELQGQPLAEFWNARLTHDSGETYWGTRQEILFVLIASLLAGLLAKLPAFFAISEDFFYPRNIGFIVFPALTAFFAWKHKLSSGKAAFIAGATVLGLIFINILPDDPKSDTLILSCLHLPLYLWILLGFTFVGGAESNDDKRLGYLKYNGDLLVITALILIAGGIMTGITIGLFSLIGFNIEEFYFEYVAVFGLAAAPIVGTYLIRSNPALVGRVSPVIAKIFSPLVLVMLVIYLGAMVYSGKDPYNDREFLIVFNGLLIGVMAIIFFSVVETARTKLIRIESWVLFLLSAVTVIVSGIALSAIIFRILEYGITPNRAAVAGGNILMLIHLLLVTVQLFRLALKKGNISAVGKAIAEYLPVYFVWAIVVVFIFPFVFGFE